MKLMPLPASERRRMEALSWRRDISLQERLDVQIGWAARVLYPAMINPCMCPACISQPDMRELRFEQPTALELQLLAKTPADESTCDTLRHGGLASWHSLADVAGLPWSDALSWEQIRDSAPAGTALRRRRVYPLELGLHDDCYERLLRWLAPITAGACGIAWMPMDGPQFTWEGTELETFEGTPGEVLDLIQANDGYPPNTCWSLDGAWGIANDRVRHCAAIGISSAPDAGSLEATGLEWVPLLPDQQMP